jgi:hypothetical protein
MSISYRGIKITGNSGQYRARIGSLTLGPFEHYSDVEEAIDEHVCDFDDENIYGLASIRQSIEEDRR